MNENSYISGIEVNLHKIIDYIFHDISQNEENQMEDFFDNNEELAATVEELLDFCLEQGFSHVMVRHFEKRGGSPALNDLLDTIEYQLETIDTKPNNNITLQQKQVEPIKAEVTPVVEKKTVSVTVKKVKKIIKALFTILLVMNMPFWNTTGDYNNSNLLKASQKEQVQQMMILSDYEIRYMRVDMLDDRPITDFMTDVAIPSNFEMRYVTED